MITIVVYRHMGVDETHQLCKICLAPSFNTIIMDNSHDPQNDDVRHQLIILMLTVRFMYKLCYGVQVIFYIFLLNI